RRSGRRVGAARRRVRRAARGRGLHGRCARRVLSRAARQLQEARDRPLRPRAAEEHDGQDPAEGSARAARRGVSALAARARARASVALGVRDGVARIVLERAETGNALDEALSTALAEACAAVDEDDAVRAVVLAARGADFSVGLPAERAWPDAAWPDAIGAVAAIAKP